MNHGTSFPFADLVHGACRDTHGDSATHIPQGGDAQSLTLVWDSAYTEVVFDGDGVPMDDVRPRFWGAAADFDSEPRQDDKITRAGIDWLVTKVEPDGGGGIWLYVHEVGA